MFYFLLILDLKFNLLLFLRILSFDICLLYVITLNLLQKLLIV